MKRPQLHIYFMIGLCGWILYMTFDIVIFIIAPISINPPFLYLEYQGYMLDYPSLLIANILRDIGFLGLLIISWSYFIASFSLRYGENRTNQWILKNKISLFIIFAFSILLDIGDRIKITIREGEVYVSSTWVGVPGTFLILVIVLYFIGAGLLNASLDSTLNANSDAKYRKKIHNIMAGLIIMGVGDVYWAVIGKLRQRLDFQEFILQHMIYYNLLYYIGHIIWIISPIFLYLGLRDSHSEE